MKNLFILSMLAIGIFLTNIPELQAKKIKKVDGPLVMSFEAPKRVVRKSKGMKPHELETVKQYEAVAEILNQCAFEVSPFEDRRQNKLTIGSTAQKPLLITEVDSWLEAASAEMLEKELISNAVASRRIIIEPKLTRLYAYAQNMNIHGVSALHVDFRENGQIIESRDYRALGSTVNWNNGEHEFLDAADASLKNVIPELLFDLPNICNSEIPEMTPHLLK